MLEIFELLISLETIEQDTILAEKDSKSVIAEIGTAITSLVLSHKESAKLARQVEVENDEEETYPSDGSPRQLGLVNKILAERKEFSSVESLVSPEYWETINHIKSVKHVTISKVVQSVAASWNNVITKHEYAKKFQLRAPNIINFTEWKISRASEAKFWDGVIEQGGQSWTRFDRHQVLPEVFRTYFGLPLNPSSVNARRIFFLVVGSGPSSHIGYKGWSDVMLNLFLTDPLASLYEELFNKHHVFPPALIHDVTGEELTATFSTAAFDMVYSVNAIDHTADPIIVLQQMQPVLKPCSVAVVEMWENEAYMAGGTGIHQWNFFYKDGTIFLQKFGTDHVRDVRAMLRTSGAGEVICQRFSGCFLNGDCNYPEKPRLRLRARKSSSKSCVPIVYPDLVQI